MGRIIGMKVTAQQRRELEAIVSRASEAASTVRRARVVLLSADELPGQEMAFLGAETPPPSGGWG